MCRFTLLAGPRFGMLSQPFLGLALLARPAGGCCRTGGPRDAESHLHLSWLCFALCRVIALRRLWLHFPIRLQLIFKGVMVIGVCPTSAKCNHKWETQTRVQSTTTSAKRPKMRRAATRANMQPRLGNATTGAKCTHKCKATKNAKRSHESELQLELQPQVENATKGTNCNHNCEVKGCCI